MYVIIPSNRMDNEDLLIEKLTWHQYKQLANLIMFTVVQCWKRMAIAYFTKSLLKLKPILLQNHLQSMTLIETYCITKQTTFLPTVIVWAVKL